jgi:flagellar hook-length control protein FliK
MEIPFLQATSKQDQAARPIPSRAGDAHDRGKNQTARFEDAYDANGEKAPETDEVKASDGGEASGAGDATREKPSESPAGDAKHAKAQAQEADAADADKPVAGAETTEAETPVPTSEAGSTEAQQPKKTAQQADMAEMVMQHRLKSGETARASTPASAAGSDPVLKAPGQSAVAPVEVMRAKGIDATAAKEATKATGSDPEVASEEPALKTRSAETSFSATKPTPAATLTAAGQTADRSLGLRRAAADESDLRATRFTAEGRQSLEAQDISQQVASRPGTKNAQPMQSTAGGAINGSLETSKLQVAETQFMDMQPVEGADAEFASFKDMRTSAPASLAQVLSRPETPGQIAPQMAEAAQRMQDQTVQIALNPKELGKVKMQISALEGVVTVNLVAERPETLDLMRRNIQDLVREFHALGYDTVNFSFAEGQSGADTERNDRDGDKRHLGSPAGQTEMRPAEEASIIQMIPSDGLDLRL